MGGEGWLQRHDRPRQTSDFEAMPWQDFEDFALDVLRAQYEPQGIILRSTGRGPDGGRDAEGKLKIGTIDALAVELLLWVEVKHHNAPVGRKSTGSHLVAAMNAAANILVIVSSSGFSSLFRSELERFSFRAGLRAVLVDGDTLLAIADMVGHANDGAAMPKRDELNEATLSIRHLDFSLSASLAAGLGRTRLLVRSGTPVFVAVAFDFHWGTECHDFTIELETDGPGIEFVPLDHGPLVKAASGERLVRVFLVKGREGARVATSEIVCRAVALPGGPSSFEVRAAPQAEKDAGTASVEFLPPTVGFSATRDQADALQQIIALNRDWRAEGGVVSVSIEAAAGVGKSALVARARWLWLEAEARELVVDGATENSVWSLFWTMLTHLLPTEGALAATFGKTAIREWFEALGSPAAIAARLADAVCARSPRDTNFGPGELTDVLAAMLRRLARRHPLVFVFEDLHKAGGSVLRLVHAAREQLRLDGGVPVLFCFTSRFAAEGFTGDGTAEAWAGERERLLGDEHNRRLRLGIPTGPEAQTILTGAIPHLYPEVAEDMIDRVGTAPFALGELVRFLVDRGCLERDETGHRLRLTPGADLRNELRLADLVSRTATDQRLETLVSRLPAWGSDFVDAGACLGREFQAERLIARIDYAPTAETELDALLGQLVREGVVGPTAGSAGRDWRFEHDLIREAILARLARPEHQPRHLRLVRKLADSAEWTEATLLSLVYQMGDAERFVRLADECATDLRRGGYAYEAAAHFALANQVLDPAAPGIVIGDAVFRVFPRPRLVTPPPAERLIDAKRRLFETLSIVSGGADETAKRLITDVRMLAERIRDRRLAALAERWEGNLGIALGDNLAAVRAFEQAERLYAMAGAETGDLFQSILGKGIALRLLGETEASAAELERALRLDADDPRAQVRFHANFGALFFYSDPRQRREHWERALTIARENGLEDLSLHMDLDVVSIDILEEREGARERIERLIAQTSERHFEDQLMRSLVMASALDLAHGEPHSALARLNEARRVGYANDARRRLWKVHMNSATAYELTGDHELATHEQTTMLNVVTAVAWERRIALGPANVVLKARQQEHDAAAQALLPLIPAESRKTVNSIVGAVETDKPLTGRFPLEHLRSLPCGRRFIAV